MRHLNRRVWMAATLLACLLLAGCGRTPTPADGESDTPAAALEYAPFPELETPGGTVAVFARFRSARGEALPAGTACLAVEDASASFPLDSQGEIRVSGLPREGTVDLTLYDEEDRAQGHTTLLFSLGAVIDASTDEAGDGYVTTRADTEAVALQFTVSGGTLRCALRLDEYE